MRGSISQHLLTSIQNKTKPVGCEERYRTMRGGVDRHAEYRNAGVDGTGSTKRNGEASPAAGIQSGPRIL